jgi:hypothetical protein
LCEQHHFSVGCWLLVEKKKIFRWLPSICVILSLIFVLWAIPFLGAKGEKKKKEREPDISVVSRFICTAQEAPPPIGSQLLPRTATPSFSLSLSLSSFHRAAAVAVAAEK